MKILNRFIEHVYNIGFITKSVESVLTEGIGSGDIVWMKHKYKDRFFADPFLIKKDSDNFYILCEEFIFWERVGRITLLTVDRCSFNLKKRNVLIKEEHHLSFPFCQLNGEWVIPEASWSGKCFAYLLDVETMSVIKKVQIAEAGMIDNIFYKSSLGTIWMYAGKRETENEALYVYELNKDNYFRQVSAMPVETGLCCSRSAGLIFEYKGDLYRPVQDCSEKYGRQTKIMKILKIGESGYEAEEYCVLNSFSNPLYDETMHTFNVYEDIILVDGSKDILRLPRNFFYTRFCIRIWSYICKLLGYIN